LLGSVIEEECRKMPRYKSTEGAPAGRPVQIEVDGRRYEGTYTVDGPAVTVDTLLFGFKRVLIGDQSPEVAAPIALLELVHANMRRDRRHIRHRTNMTMEPMQVCLELSQKKALQTKARAHGTRLAEEVRRAVGAYLAGVSC
jgi:hypothetical protein